MTNDCTRRTSRHPLRALGCAAAALLLAATGLPGVHARAEGEPYLVRNGAELNAALGDEEGLKEHDNIIEIDPAGLYNNTYNVTIPDLTLRAKRDSTGALGSVADLYGLNITGSGTKLQDIDTEILITTAGVDSIGTSAAAVRLQGEAPKTITGLTVRNATLGLEGFALDMGANTNSDITGNIIDAYNDGFVHSYLTSIGLYSGTQLYNFLLKNEFKGGAPLYVDAVNGGITYTIVFPAMDIFANDDPQMHDLLTTATRVGITPQPGVDTIELLADLLAEHGNYPDLEVIDIVGFQLTDPKKQEEVRAKFPGRTVVFSCSQEDDPIVPTPPAPTPRPDRPTEPTLRTAPPKPYDALTYEQTRAATEARIAQGGIPGTAQGPDGSPIAVLSYAVDQIGIAFARILPEDGAPVLAAFGYGEIVQVPVGATVDAGGWIEVVLPGGARGYMKAEALGGM